MTRKIRLGLFLQPNGRHPDGWRLPESHGRGDDIEWVIEVARTAERAKFDLVFAADGLTGPSSDYRGTVNGFEPLTELTAVARGTTQIGVVATASTSYSEPYNVARQFASLDRISGGRAGWNVVTSRTDGPARNFNQDRALAHADRYELADEFVEVVLGLWGTFPADYYVGDKETGVFADHSRVQPLGHRGHHFSVEGPLNIPASAQGHPVIAQATASEDGIEVAGKYAELVYTVQDALPDAQDFYRKIKNSAIRAGRDPRSILVMPGVMPIVAETDAEAQAIWTRLRDLADVHVALKHLSWRFGVDLTGLDPDGPVPDPPSVPDDQSRVRLLLEAASRNGWTLGETAKYAAASYGHRILVGTPSFIADQLEEWFNDDAADGFNIITAYMPGSLDAFTSLVVPELQRRGLFREEYEGQTLRANLGLEAS